MIQYCAANVMTRTYSMTRRAERQNETRQRIVEAAVALHGSVGPAATTVSLLAEQAGVQRHTVYAHFPDERSLLLACSALSLEREPLPDAKSWRDIAGGAERLRTGLTAVYGWYQRNAALAACVLRDAEHHAPTREISELRFGPPMGEWRAVLGEGLGKTQRALLHLALDFAAWRALVRDSGLPVEAAAAAMAQAIVSAGASPRAKSAAKAQKVSRAGRRSVR